MGMTPCGCAGVDAFSCSWLAEDSGLEVGGGGGGGGGGCRLLKSSSKPMRGMDWGRMTCG